MTSVATASHSEALRLPRLPLRLSHLSLKDEIRAMVSSWVQHGGGTLRGVDMMVVGVVVVVLGESWSDARVRAK